MEKDIWRSTQWPALSLLVCYLVWDLIKILGLIPTLIFQLTLVYSLYLLYFDFAGEPQFNFHIRLSMGQAIVWMLSAALVLIHGKRKLFDRMKLGLMIFATLNAALMVVHHFQGKTATGMIPGHTIASTFLACSFPFFLEECTPSLTGYLLCLLQVLTVFLAGGSTGVLCLLAVCIIYFERIKFTALILLFLSPLLVLMPKEDLQTFWNPHGRVAVWMEGIRQWGEGTLIQKLLGFGTGSWEWLFSARYYRTGQMHDAWLFAHNDYLQVIYEQGLLGFVALVIVMLKVVKRCKDPLSRACVTGYLIAMSTQSVMRIACLQLLGLYWIASIGWGQKVPDNFSQSKKMW